MDPCLSTGRVWVPLLSLFLPSPPQCIRRRAMRAVEVVVDVAHGHALRDHLSRLLDISVGPRAHRHWPSVACSADEGNTGVGCVACSALYLRRYTVATLGALHGGARRYTGATRSLHARSVDACTPSFSTQKNLVAELQPHRNIEPLARLCRSHNAKKTTADMCGVLCLLSF